MLLRDHIAFIYSPMPYFLFLLKSSENILRIVNIICKVKLYHRFMFVNCKKILNTLNLICKEIFLLLYFDILC